MKIISPIGFLHIIHGNWEIESRRFFEKNIQKGDVVLDIGACNGLYTLLFSKLVGPNGMVYAFEPDPTMFKVLSANIRINSLKNVVACRMAISDTDRTAKFYLTSAGMSSLQPMKGLRSIIDIDIVAIDSLNLDDVDWVKIDTEGTEHLVLKGAERTLHENAPRLLIEFLPQFGNTDLLLQALDGWKIQGLDHNILCERINPLESHFLSYLFQ